MKRVIGTIVVAAVAFTAGAWAQSTGISLDRANTWASQQTNQAPTFGGGPRRRTPVGAHPPRF